MDINYGKIKKYTLRASIGAAAVASLVAGGAYLKRYLHEREMKEEIAKEVATMMDCKIKGQETKGCLDDDKRANLLDSAAKMEKAADFRSAGLIYIRLGDHERALGMAKLCHETGKEGEEEINERIQIRGKAIQIYVDTPKRPEQEAPKPGSSSSRSDDAKPSASDPSNSAK